MSNLPAPKVSVIVPLYNGVEFLDETLESVLAQTFRDFEIVIVDDKSNDGAFELAKQWAARYSDRIRVLTHPDHANRGASASRNLAMIEARADLFAFLDSDDTWPADKLAEQVDLFARHDELDLVGGAALYWRSWTGGTDKLIKAGHRQDIVVPPVETALHTYPLGAAQAPCPSTLMVTRELIARIGGFEEEFIGPYAMYEDQALLIKCYLHGHVFMANSTYCQYRQHDQSVMAISRSTGGYNRVRRFFLDWLRSYLQRNNITDRRIRTKMNHAYRLSGNPARRLLARIMPR